MFSFYPAERLARALDDVVSVEKLARMTEKTWGRPNWIIETKPRKVEEETVKHSARASLLALLGSALSFVAPAWALPGPKYEFPEHGSPGVEMELKEASREKRGKVTYVYYNLSTRGLTPGQKLNLYQWVWTLSDGLLSQAGFEVNSDGKVICSKPPEGGVSGEESKHWCQATLEETTLAAAGFQRGQAFRLGLISADGQQKAFAESMPFPIESEDQGCRLFAERVSENADSWIIKGDGFKPGDSVHYELKGPGNSMEGDAKLSEKGGLALVVRPPKSGTLSGTVTVKVSASTCRPVLRFKWGVSAIELP